MSKMIKLDGVEYDSFMSSSIPTDELTPKSFRKLIETRRRHETKKHIEYSRKRRRENGTI